MAIELPSTTAIQSNSIQSLSQDLHVLFLSGESYTLLEPITEGGAYNNIKNPVNNLVSSQSELKSISIGKKIELKNGDRFEFNAEGNIIYHRKLNNQDTREVREFSSPGYSLSFSSIQGVKYSTSGLKISVFWGLGFVLSWHELSKILINISQSNDYIRKKGYKKEDGTTYTHNLYVTKKQ